MIVDDSCFRLTTLMIGHDSFSVGCFGNHRPDSETFRCKWQCPPLAILPPIFTLRFRFSFCSIPFSVLSSTNSLQILHLPYFLPTDRLPENKLPPSFVAKMSWVYKFHCLTGHHLVFTFLREKSLELATRVTLLARLLVNYRQISRTSVGVWLCER